MVAIIWATMLVIFNRCQVIETYLNNGSASIFAHLVFKYDIVTWLYHMVTLSSPNNT